MSEESLRRSAQLENFLEGWFGRQTDKRLVSCASKQRVDTRIQTLLMFSGAERWSEVQSPTGDFRAFPSAAGLGDKCRVM